MSSKSAAVNVEEERLAHALVSRGLISQDEADQCRSTADGPIGPEALLDRLTSAGFLTSHQAKRARQELSLLLEQRIPGYQLVDKLGEGSMGKVYKARQLSMNRLVAIKVLPPRLAANPGFLDRFTREAHIAAKLSHNNIVQAIDVGSAGKINYFVMEYVEGTTIARELEKGKVYEEREAVDICLQVAQALEHAHRRQLIHRDVKPANIMITPEGVAKLADLGLARESTNEDQAREERGRVFGTPYYMAPEQIRGQEDVDIRADIYALGATLYHMVTGQYPFSGKTVEAIFRAHLEQELVPPDHLNQKLSSGLGEVVEVMMAKDRRKRYPTPADLVIDLECLLAGQPPKLARERVEAATLQHLAHGDDAEEEDDNPEAITASEQRYRVWVLVLAGVLAGSLLLNVVQLLRG